MQSSAHPFQGLETLKTINVADASELKNHYENLLSMDISSKEEFLRFQMQRDLIDMHFVNEMAESHFLNSIDVSNDVNKKRKDHFEQVISPLFREYDDRLNKKFLESPIPKELGETYKILIRNLRAANELYRIENLELHKQIDQISSRIQEIQAKMLADWNGEKVPLPILHPFLKSSSRDERKKAYESLLSAQLEVAEVVDGLFDQLLSLRHQVAKNAGYSSYTPYRFKELNRFDWNESDCFEFHRAVKELILPVREKLLRKRRRLLELNTLKPFDLSVDMYGRDPLMLYEKGRSQDLIEGAGKIVRAIDSELYKYFCEIRDNGLLDLETRKNKAPGGYMVMYPIYEKASVFYNGSGLAQDLMVVLHELGHCFHYFLGKNIRPFGLQAWTSEVAEAGSMSMEYMGLERLQEYLDADSAKRVKEDKLMSILGLFVMCAKGDEFQHWLYSNPGHSSESRKEKWLQLSKEYSAEIDMDGYEEAESKVSWQFGHILNMPFYLIDYSISELLALSIWDRYKKDPADGIDRYKKGCSIAASKTVPEIYETFGTKLSFNKPVIAPLAKRLEQELGLTD